MRRVPVEKTAATVAAEQFALAKLVPDLRAHAHAATGALLILGASDARAATGNDSVKVRKLFVFDRCTHRSAFAVQCSQLGGQFLLASGNARAHRIHSGSKLFHLGASLRQSGFVRLGPFETLVFVAFHPLGFGCGELNLVLYGSGLLGGGDGVELNAEAGRFFAMVADFAIQAGAHRVFTAQRGGEIGRLALGRCQRSLA